MKTYHLLFVILPAVLICGCQKIGQPVQKYYAPNNYILGQEEETMLWTDYATLEVTPYYGTADVVFSFKGRKVPDVTVEDFDLDIPGVFCEQDGQSYIFYGECVEGTITYTREYYDENKMLRKKTGSLTREFSISGTVYTSDPSKSSVTITATVLDKPISLSIQNITSNRLKASFGQPGYPSYTGGVLNGKMMFINDSGHGVTVQHSDFRGKAKISPGGSGGLSVLETSLNCYFTFTFDDGRVYKSMLITPPYGYEGLSYEIKPTPFISFNSGLIHYEDDHVCYYTITPELYANAVIPE